MKNVDVLKRWFRMILTVSLVVGWGPNFVNASSKAVTPSDLKNGDPIELTALIMEIDYGTNTLVVAEKYILVVDLNVGAELLKTVLTNEDGEAIAFDSLNRGQKVLVKGLKLPDGRVVAGRIQLAAGDSGGLTNGKHSGVRRMRKIRPIK